MPTRTYGVRRCETCGKEFVAKSTTQLFCSAKCKNSSPRYLEYRRRYNKEYKERYKSTMRESVHHKGLRKSPSIGELAREARAAGMSYGNFVAMRRIAGLFRER